MLIMYKRELLFWAKQSFFMYLSFWHDLIYSSCERNVFYDYKFVCLLVSPCVRNPRDGILIFLYRKILNCFPGICSLGTAMSFSNVVVDIQCLLFSEMLLHCSIYHVGRFLSLHWFLLLCLHLGRR